MSALPPITIVTTTWAPEGEVGEARGRVANDCIYSWLEELHYDGELRLHIADDGSNNEFYRKGENFLPGDMWKEYPEWQVSFSRQERKGVGASLNAGFAEAFKTSPLAMYVVEDWEMVESFNLNPWARLLLQEQGIGAVRLGPPHPDLTGIIKHFQPCWAMVLDRHHFAFSHRPTLFHKRFMDAYGPHPEGVDALACERAYNERFIRMKGPEIAYALQYPWRHVGEAEVGNVTP